MWTGIVLSLALGQAAAPPVPAVTLNSVSEHRSKQIDQKTTGFNSEDLSLVLELKGPTVKDAFKHGNLKVTLGEDDLKTDLVRRLAKGETFGYTSDQPELKRFEDYLRTGEGKDLMRVYVNLKAPPRAAKNVSIKGSYDLLVGGTPGTAEFPKVRALEGTTLKNADLDAIGLKVNVLKPGKNFFGKPEQTLLLTYEGDDRLVSEVNVLDGAGKKIEGNLYSNVDFMNKKLKNVSFNCNSSIPADAKLQIKVAKDAKSVTVPFEFKNVELP